MKILQVHSPYRIAAGEDTVVTNEARLLRGAGHDLWQFLEPNPDAAATTVAATLAAPWNPLSAAELRSRLRAERPDVAHVHNTWFRLSPSALSALRRSGVPVVRTMHNYRMFCIEGQTHRDGRACTDCLGHGPWAGVRHGCYRSRPLSAVAAATVASQRLLDTDDAVDLFVVPSTFVRDILLRAGLPGDRTVVKPHFTFDPGTRAGPPSRSRTVMVVGRVDTGKGVDLLLDAWSRAAPTSLELEVAGSGPLVAELSASAPDGVRFVSLTHPEVLEHMLGARALIFPSMLNETFGMSVIEAMSAGLAVGGFDVAAVGEILGEGSEDLLAPAGDVAALAEVLARLEDDALVDHAGATNRRCFVRRYSPEANLALLEDVYRRAIESHGRR